MEYIAEVRQNVRRAIRERKVFVVTGGYYGIKQALLARNWVEKLPENWPSKSGGAFPTLEQIYNELPRKPPGVAAEDYIKQCQASIVSKLLCRVQPNLVWSSQSSTNENLNIYKRSTKVNGFIKSPFTSKSGLCDTIYQMYWHYEDGVVDIKFPRCYNTAYQLQFVAFTSDFRLTACMGLLKKFIHQLNDVDEWSKHDPAKTLPYEAVQFAIARCQEYVEFRVHADIDRPEALHHGVTDAEWEQFLETQFAFVHTKRKFVDHTDSNVKLWMTKVQHTLNTIEPIWPQFKLDGMNNIWILKPSNAARGQGIVIVNNHHELRNLICNTHRTFVIQKYLEWPLLLHGTKFDIRQWFLVTSVEPLVVWIYRASYLRFCTHKYDINNYHESVHLTNHAVQVKYQNVKRDSFLPAENMWPFHIFKTHLLYIGHGDKWDTIIYPGMKKAIASVMLASQHKMEHRPNSFQLYGADFILDEDYQPWLLEVNSTPNMASTTRVTQKLCPQCLEDIIKVVVDCNGSRFGDTGLFDLVLDQEYTKPLNDVGQLLLTGTSISIPGAKIRQHKRGRSRGDASNPRHTPCQVQQDGTSKTKLIGDIATKVQRLRQHIRRYVLRSATLKSQDCTPQRSESKFEYYTGRSTTVSRETISEPMMGLTHYDPTAKLNRTANNQASDDLNTSEGTQDLEGRTNTFKVGARRMVNTDINIQLRKLRSIIARYIPSQCEAPNATGLQRHDTSLAVPQEKYISRSYKVKVNRDLVLHPAFSADSIPSAHETYACNLTHTPMQVRPTRISYHFRCMWTFHIHQDALFWISQGCNWDTYIFPKLKRALFKAMLSDKSNCFRVYGADIILDLMPNIFEKIVTNTGKLPQRACALVCQPFLQNVMKVIIGRQYSIHGSIGRFARVYCVEPIVTPPAPPQKLGVTATLSASWDLFPIMLRRKLEKTKQAIEQIFVSGHPAFLTSYKNLIAGRKLKRKRTIDAMNSGEDAGDSVICKCKRRKVVPVIFETIRKNVSTLRMVLSNLAMHKKKKIQEIKFQENLSKCALIGEKLSQSKQLIQNCINADRNTGAKMAMELGQEERIIKSVELNNSRDLSPPPSTCLLLSSPAIQESGSADTLSNSSLGLRSESSSSRPLSADNVRSHGKSDVHAKTTPYNSNSEKNVPWAMTSKFLTNMALKHPCNSGRPYSEMNIFKVVPAVPTLKRALVTPTTHANGAMKIDIGLPATGVTETTTTRNEPPFLEVPPSAGCSLTQRSLMSLNPSARSDLVESEMKWLHAATLRNQIYLDSCVKKRRRRSRARTFSTPLQSYGSNSVSMSSLRYRSSPKCTVSEVNMFENPTVDSYRQPKQLASQRKSIVDSCKMPAHQERHDSNFPTASQSKVGGKRTKLHKVCRDEPIAKKQPASTTSSCCNHVSTMNELQFLEPTSARCIQQKQNVQVYRVQVPKPKTVPKNQQRKATDKPEPSKPPKKNITPSRGPPKKPNLPMASSNTFFEDIANDVYSPLEQLMDGFSSGIYNALETIRELDEDIVLDLESRKYPPKTVTSNVDMAKFSRKGITIESKFNGLIAPLSTAKSTRPSLQEITEAPPQSSSPPKVFKPFDPYDTIPSLDCDFFTNLTHDSTLDLSPEPSTLLSDHSFDFTVLNSGVTLTPASIKKYNYEYQSNAEESLKRQSKQDLKASTKPKQTFTNCKPCITGKTNTPKMRPPAVRSTMSAQNNTASQRQPHNKRSPGPTSPKLNANHTRSQSHDSSLRQQKTPTVVVNDRKCTHSSRTKHQNTEQVHTKKVGINQTTQPKTTAQQNQHTNSMKTKTVQGSKPEVRNLKAKAPMNDKKFKQQRPVQLNIKPQQNVDQSVTDPQPVISHLLGILQASLDGYCPVSFQSINRPNNASYSLCKISH